MLDADSFMTFLLCSFWWNVYFLLPKMFPRTRWHWSFFCQSGPHTGDTEAFCQTGPHTGDIDAFFADFGNTLFLRSRGHPAHGTWVKNISQNYPLKGLSIEIGETYSRFFGWRIDTVFNIFLSRKIFLSMFTKQNTYFFKLPIQSRGLKDGT